ncbi:MAG TPA: hypothetical protein VFV38_25510 [Ktedonobacteraceae bacterium]|nr:hypothetical protein [Ktedonobacteraceae bacterium]
MEEWFSLQEHPDDHMLYVREMFVDDARPLRYVIWHPAGFDARVYRASFGTARIGKSLVPVPGPALAFRFEDAPDAEIIVINQHARTIETEETIPLPEIKEQYRDTIFPEWHGGKWMHCSSAQGRENWQPLLPDHLLRPSESTAGEDDG